MVVSELKLGQILKSKYNDGLFFVDVDTIASVTNLKDDEFYERALIAMRIYSDVFTEDG